MDRNRNPINRPIRRHWMVATFAVLNLMLAESIFAGGYVDGRVALEPATAINTGAISVSPTFNNDQFNDKILVGTVNNDQVKTPSTADPVSTVSGNNYHDETDIQIRGRNALNYLFTRTYNSAPSATTVDRGLGFGWVHSYGMRLESNDFGICPNCNSIQKSENANNKTSSITYTDERGGEQNFLVNETSYAVTTPKGVYDTLTLDSAAGQHTLTFRNGTKYTFETVSGNLKTTPNLTARLKFIDNSWGDRLTLTYDANGRLSTVTDNLGISGRSGLVFTYYADNHLKDITDWTGRQWRYNFSGSDLTGKTNPLNQVVSYTYQAGHLLHEIVQPLQRNSQTVKTTFNYYQNGRAFNYHNALNHTETLDYDLYRKTTRVTDPRGGIRRYSYDADGRMTKLEEADGGLLLFENQSDGIRNKKYDALGYATQYSYRLDKALSGASDTGGNVSREQDALNQTVDTTYGPYDQVATVKDKRGTVITTSFYTSTAGCALNGKPQALTLSTLNGQANVKLHDYCWNADGTLATLTEYLIPGNTVRKRVTAYTYEAGSNGLKLADTNVTGSGQTLHTHFTYDSLGRKQTETFYRRTSPTNATLLALTTTYTYDSLDRPVKVTDPEGRIQETVFDANGQVAQEKTWYPTSVAKVGCAAPSGGYVICTDATHQYDAADRRIATTDVFGKTSQFGYDEAGNLSSQIDANGHSTKYEYDAMNRKTAAIDGNGHRTETKYNLRGEAIAVTNDNGETVKSEYDAVGRLTKVVDPLGFETSFSYDANGNQTCLIDANAISNVGDPGHQPLNADGCSESRQYDELNRLKQSKDAQGNITAYSYDLLGNRLTVTDAENHTTAFHYDDLGRLTETVDPLIETPTDKTQLSVYDEAGNLIETTDRKGQVSRHTYDRLNRLTQTDHLIDSSQEVYTYDLFGDLIQSQNADVTYTYTYTAKHQLKSKTDSRSSKTLSWAYDPVGNIDTKTDYQGDITDYQYDNANRLVAETNPAYLQVSYHYDGAGRLLDRILSNGAQTRYGWDAAGRLTQLKNTTLTGQLVNDTSYTRDRLGNILTQIDHNASGQVTGTTTFGYDPAYRLLSADYPGTANDESFSYDKVGNRKTYTKAGSVKYYNVDAANQLKDIRTGSPTGTVFESYQYDANGSLTNVSGNRSLTLTWDANNRVKQINTSQYRYDPSGYRIQKAASLTSRYYLEGEHLEAIYESNGALRDQYLRGTVIDEVVNGYHRDANNRMVNSTYHHDALQSVLGQSAHDGQIQATQSYTAFGGNLSSTGTSNAAQKYTGREADGESGFYYYRARYYDPNTGRFISEDPKGFAAGINFYAYVDNNPVNANDPTGLDLISNIVSGLAKLGGRLGSAETRALNKAIADEYLATGDWVLKSGGGKAEVLIPNPATGGAKGGAYGDIVLKNIQTGKELIINTVTTRADGITPVAREIAAGVKIQNLRPDSEFQMVSKVTGGVIGATAAGSANASSGIFGTGITWNDVGNFVIDFLTPGGVGSVGAGSDIVPNTSSINWNSSNFWSSSANGGFVLYPNKANTNMMRSVYSK
ncbi:RHS repeat-associated core domain-containing protein [Methylomonas sp. 11b]|uniref:RHS repeat-associated core domain-containing protein n=1 Tax=Methylomonas sp. 11b TaxID=1168169 RepID=UPI0009DCB5A1|nr:RHS repeat-associated core domain-containing protein [Methylomonas sp. 11b]